MKNIIKINQLRLAIKSDYVRPELMIRYFSSDNYIKIVNKLELGNG
jgi:hypothetical protein